ncbi:hypothetical protein [Dyella tabacisoli]|uniref:Uncharacterized protein n=1 Tax=Dyella tabacisoli TaxID=2282381 RepID=A0A369UWW6_9GAMM|nr:hypothetical protein [Dyella tabacisoli]RDD82809.1 hypothetical protein DVJ77_04640 [Dyella tabacisoli]
MAIPSYARTSAQAVMRRLLSAMALVVLLCVAAPAAHAQWQVKDDAAEQSLDNINSGTKDINSVLGTTADGNNNTINKNLDNINNKLVIGAYNKDVPGARVADPQKALPATTAATTLNDGSYCKTIPDAQQQNCQDIVAIENAQYHFMVSMYNTSKTRDDMLRTLLAERQGIASNDPNQFGKLEDNTNKLTALYNLIALDHQQMLSVNYAYDANLRYLRNQQTQLANAAASGISPPGSGLGSIDIPGIGSIDIGSAISGMTTGLVLYGALQGQQSTPDSGMPMQKLSIESTNGW